MVDVFEEVEGEMRADQWKAIARRFAPWAIGGLLVGLLIAAAVWGWQEYQRRGAETASLAYAEALELGQRGDARAAGAKFQIVADGRSPVYKSLALMHLGAADLEANKPADAAAKFDQAAEAAPDEILADSARLKAVFARMDSQPYPQSVTQLMPLAAEGRPYRLLALEALALAKLGAGDSAGARGDVVVLSIAPDAPEGVRTRAQALLQLIDSGAAGSLAPIAKAAAALPPTAPAEDGGGVPLPPELAARLGAQ